MKFSYIILTVVVLQNGFIEILGYLMTPEIADKGNCSKITSFQRSRYVSYRETYRQSWFMTGTRRNYRLVYYPVYYIIQICCKGYEMNIFGNRCNPICKPNCGNGTCIAPNVCSCDAGYTFQKNIVSGCESACVPKCVNSCVHGKCTAPNTCTCDNGYSLSTDEYTCYPICNPPCSKNSYCSKPDRCTCNNGYFLTSTNECKPICNKTCINGTCVAPEICSCFEGYEFLENSKYICKPICEKACVNGKCTEPAVCTCNETFRLRGDQPEKHICMPSDCETFCKPFGTCTATDVCTCFEGYQLANTTQTEQNSMQHFEDLFQPLCKPVCLTPCVNAFCSAPNTCTCNKGYHQSDSDPTVCKPTCSRNCINSFCSAPETCTCNEGYEHFNASICEPICSTCGNGTCVAPEVCECNDGFILEDSNIKIWEYQSASENKSQNGSRCMPYCESCDNGECVAPNECQCDAGFVEIEGDCVQACQDGCGSHGECIEKLRTCKCNYGWSGLHCDQPTLCVLTLSDDGNRTEPLIIEERNATIEYVLINNPTCSECINEINDETACFKIYINSTENETQIGCLMDRVKCLALKSQYKSKWRKILKIIGITCVTVILLLICTVIATYVILQKCQIRQINITLGNVQTDRRQSVSMLRLIEQCESNS